MLLVRKCVLYHRLGNIPFGAGGWEGRKQKVGRESSPPAGYDKTQKKQAFLLTLTAGLHPLSKEAGLQQT